MDCEPAFPKVQGAAAGVSESAALEEVSWQAVLGGLTGEVVHALNNGLFGVLANLELLLGDADPESESAVHLRLAQGSARELAETVSALGLLARDEGGRASLDELARSIAGLLRRTAPLRTVEERYPVEPVPVAADPAAARRLVAHVLLQAAAAAGPAGALELDVAAEGDRAVLRARCAGGGGREAPELLLAAAQGLARRIGGSLTAEDAAELRLELPLG